MSLPPSGMNFSEFYLYANKRWDTLPSGISAYNLSGPVLQNAPVIVTSSGFETTTSSDPWGQVDGSGKWQKRGHGFFTVSPAGVYDTNVKEFTLNPSASGRIEFNQTLKEIVYVEYESWPSGYYWVTDININPVMRETDSGFLQITNVGDPIYLSLKTTQSILKGDGYQAALLTATLYDGEMNRIQGEDIAFEMLFDLDGAGTPSTDIGSLIAGVEDGATYALHPSGFIYKTRATTNRFGQATATFKTRNDAQGWTEIKAFYIPASDIYDIVDIVCYKWTRGPFILDRSLLDSLDYLDNVVWAVTGIPGV